MDKFIDIFLSTSNSIIGLVRPVILFVFGLLVVCLFEGIFVGLLHLISDYINHFSSSNWFYSIVSLVLLIFLEILVYFILASIIISQIDIFAKKDDSKDCFFVDLIRKKLKWQNYIQILFHIIILYVWFNLLTFLSWLIMFAVLFIANVFGLLYSFRE